MPEVEDRLRAALHNAADELPASTDPGAELRRRLAARRRARRRVPALAGAAAVVVLAGVAVPVALDRDRAGPGGLGGVGPRPPTASATRAPQSSEPWREPWAHFRHPPFFIPWNRSPERGPVLSLGLSRGGEFCGVLVEEGREPADGPTVCEPLPDFTKDVVVTRTASAIADELSAPAGLRAEVDHMLLFLARPDVTRLVVRRADGTEVHGASTHIPELSFAVADFGGPTEGFGYTAYDRDGNVVAQAIT